MLLVLHGSSVGKLELLGVRSAPFIQGYLSLEESGLNALGQARACCFNVGAPAVGHISSACGRSPGLLLGSWVSSLLLLSEWLTHWAHLFLLPQARPTFLLEARLHHVSAAPLFLWQCILELVLTCSHHSVYLVLRSWSDGSFPPLNRYCHISSLVSGHFWSRMLYIMWL